MFPVLSLLFFIFLNFVQCQDPRKRYSIDLNDFNPSKDNLGCALKNCLKRSPNNLEEMGPFWANRGKKDPYYTQEKLYVDEPHWILVRNDPDVMPFFTSRGKKHIYWKALKYLSDDTMNARRDRRYSAGDDIDPAFFAARGKKLMEKY